MSLNMDEFAQQIRIARRRVAGLEQQAQEARPPDLLPKVLEELHVAFAELQTVEEELQGQNAQLLGAFQETEAARRRYQDLFEFAPDGYLVTSVQGTIQEANRAAAQLLGLSQQLLIDKPLASFVVDYSRRAFRTDMARLRRLAEPQRWEVCFQPHGGEPFDAELTVAAVRDWSGEPTSLRWMLRDINARKRAEDQIRRLSAELDRLLGARTTEPSAASQQQEAPFTHNGSARDAGDPAQRRLAFLGEATELLADATDYRSALVRVASLAVSRVADWCVVDLINPDGSAHRLAVAHADPAKVELAQAIKGHDLRSLIAPQDLPRLLQNDAPELVADVSDALLETSVPDRDYLQTLRGLGLTSAICAPIRMHGRALGLIWLASAESRRRYDQDDLALVGRLARLVALVIDTARRGKEAARAVQAHETFLTIASQEFKEPLAVIVSYTELLQRRVARGDILRGRDLRGLRMLADQGARLMTLVDALVNLSRIEQDQSAIERRPLDLAALARQTVEEVQPTLARHTVVFEGADEPLIVLGDLACLKQVAQSLIQNAIKYIAMGGPIAVRAERSADRACLSVGGQGGGIPAEVMARLVRRSSLTGDGDSFGFSDLGIGLYVVREIVGLHGGEIELLSQGEQSTGFMVRLPLAGDQTADSASA